MRRAIAISVAMWMVAAQCLWAGGNPWNRLRYAGGTIGIKVSPYDWNTTLGITPNTIVLRIAYRQNVVIKPAQVVAVSYGKEAHRRVADMVALSFVATPLALFGLLHESKVHYIGIQYDLEGGKHEALLLEAHKDDYRAILAALAAITGKPVVNAP